MVFHPLKTFLRKAAQRTRLSRYVGSYIRTLNPSKPWATSNILAMHHYDWDVLVTARGIATPTGGRWHPQSVLRVLGRLGLPALGRAAGMPLRYSVIAFRS
jgi:hypothetical protein